MYWFQPGKLKVGLLVYIALLVRIIILEIGGVVIDENYQFQKIPYRPRYCESLGKMRLKTLNN